MASLFLLVFRQSLAMFHQTMTIIKRPSSSYTKKFLPFCENHISKKSKQPPSWLDLDHHRPFFEEPSLQKDSSSSPLQNHDWNNFNGDHRAGNHHHPAGKCYVVVLCLSPFLFIFSLFLGCILLMCVITVPLITCHPLRPAMVVAITTCRQFLNLLYF